MTNNKPTTAEEHECEYKLIMETQDSNMKRLIADLEQAEAQRKEAMELLRERSQALHQLHKKPSKFVATWLICMKEPCPSDRAFLLQPQPTTPECERVSVCCGAPEHSDVENFCAQCREGTGFECSVDEVEWGEGECPKKEKVG